jgi:hypothetical protein
MPSYSSFLKKQMKKEFAVLSEAFGKTQEAYEMELRRVLLRYIDGCLTAKGEDTQSADFDEFKRLHLKTKIFQDRYVNPEFECTSNFEQLERLICWLLDPKSDPDYEFDTLKLSKETFDQIPVSVKKHMLSLMEYNLNMYIEVHALDQEREPQHVPLPS